jgi:hypothetical protein
VFGQRKVGVAASLRMTVHELQETAAQISGLASTDISLMCGGSVLPLAGVLGDFISPNEMRGTMISVVSSLGLNTNNASAPVPRPPTVTGQSHSPGSIASDSSPSSLDDDTMASFLINLVVEDGDVAQLPVAPHMRILQILEQVATSMGVHASLVTLVFQGTILELDRLVSPIVRNSYVYVMLGVQSVSPRGLAVFPPPPRPPQPHGPDLPPGFVRQAPAPAPTTTTGSTFVGSATRGNSAADKFRATFKCPKFLGEARQWKTWHQGFIRFISIQLLDHVIAEGFLSQAMTPQLHEDNKLVYYVLEEAVSGSVIALKYVRRAPIWDGHTAYVIL